MHSRGLIVGRKGLDLQRFIRMTGQLRESYAGLERKVDERTAALTEALEQQTATADILRVTVMTLRRKLDDPPVIITVPGIGYRL